MKTAPLPGDSSVKVTGWVSRVQALLVTLSLPGRFASAMSLYLLLLFSLRLALFPGASEDDAEVLLLSQSFEQAYKTGQPPLYIWLVYGLTQLFGPVLPPVVALKYVLLAGVYVLTYRLGRLFTDEDVLSVVAGLSVFGIYYLSWDAVLNYSQTVMLAVLSLAIVHTLVRIGIQSAPRWRDYVWLGVLMGIGILAKYNFALLLVAVLVASAMDRDLRAKLARRGFVSVLMAIAILLPHGVWLSSSELSMGAATSAAPDIDGTMVSIRLHGLLDMVEAVVSILSPLLFMVIVFFPRILMRLKTDQVTKVRWLRFCERAFFVLIAIIFGMILMFGMSEVRNHWFIVLVPFPAYVMLRVSTAYPETDFPSKRMAGFTCALLVMGAAVCIGVSARAMMLTSDCGKCKMVVTYDQLANELENAGFDKGTIYVYDHPTQVGGNLRRYFPESRFISFRFDAYVPPQDDTRMGQCLAVWLKDAGAMTTSREAVLDQLSRRFGVTMSTDDRLQTIDLSLPGRQEPLRYVFILINDPERQGDCR